MIKSREVSPCSISPCLCPSLHDFEVEKVQKSAKTPINVGFFGWKIVANFVVVKQ